MRKLSMLVVIPLIPDNRKQASESTQRSGKGQAAGSPSPRPKPTPLAHVPCTRPCPSPTCHVPCSCATPLAHVPRGSPTSHTSLHRLEHWDTAPGSGSLSADSGRWALPPTAQTRTASQLSPARPQRASGEGPGGWQLCLSSNQIGREYIN